MIRRLGILCIACVALLLGGCEGTLFAGLNATNPRAGIELRRDIAFDAADGLDLDVYRPAAATHAPVVVFFYGGSWVNGRRQWYRFVGAALAAHGVVAVIPDYRKYPQVGLDGYMRDAAQALRWTRDHATEFGGDPRALFVMGHSSGGHIAALLATDPAWLAAEGMQPRELAGFIGLAGVYDFVPIPAYETDMLAMFGRDPATQLLAEPVHYVQGTEPPMLLLHGTADHEVAPSNSISLAHVMQEHGEDATLKLYPGVAHSALLFAVSRPLRGHAPTLADLLAFIHAHMPR